MAEKALNVDRVRLVLAKHPKIEAAYLFGSAAKECLGPESDLDVAVLPAERLTASECLDLVEELVAATGRPVDVVNLRGCGPILGMQVLRHGRLIFQRRNRPVAEFEMSLLSSYFDLKLDRAPAEKALIAALTS